LINLSNLVGSVFLTDQGKNIEDNLERIKRFSDQIEKLDPEEFELFFAWAKNILMRGKPETEVSEAIEILDRVRPGEVIEMISNMERNLQKAFEDAEKQGVEKGMEKGKTIIAKRMLARGEDEEKIMEYTGLSKEELAKLRQ